MTKKKVLKTVQDLTKILEKTVAQWIRDCRTELGFNITTHGTGIQVTLGNAPPKSCLAKHETPPLTSVQKNEIREFLVKLVEKVPTELRVRLQLITRSVIEAGRQMSCFFEIRPVVVSANPA